MEKTIAVVRYIAKALIALIGGGIAAVIIALQALPEGASLGDIDTLGWFLIASAVIVVAGTVFGVPNGSKPSE